MFIGFYLFNNFTHGQLPEYLDNNPLNRAFFKKGKSNQQYFLFKSGSSSHIKKLVDRN
jgi:hypothetical protein